MGFSAFEGEEEAASRENGNRQWVIPQSQIESKYQSNTEKGCILGLEMVFSSLGAFWGRRMLEDVPDHPQDAYGDKVNILVIDRP